MFCWYKKFPRNPITHVKLKIKPTVNSLIGTTLKKLKKYFHFGSVSSFFLLGQERFIKIIVVITRINGLYQFGLTEIKINGNQNQFNFNPTQVSGRSVIRKNPFQMGALESIRILASDEGRALRDTHKANVSYLREKLFDAGVWAQHTPSHIIPVHVSLKVRLSIV